MADLETSTSLVESIHVIPGRARFRVRGLYHCPASKYAIERELSLRHRIDRVSANPLTGNVLIEFDNQIDSSKIAALLEEVVSGDYSSGNGSFDDLNSDSVRWADGNRNSRRNSLARHRRSPELANSGENGWHRLDVKTVVTRFGSSKAGLPELIAADRVKAWGPNRLPELQERSAWTILLEQFDSMPTVLLIVAAGISICTGGLSDAIAIGGVLAINAALGFFTESESENAIRSLKSVVQPTATVIRDGDLRQVPSERVVPGDADGFAAAIERDRDHGAGETGCVLAGAERERGIRRRNARARQQPDQERRREHRGQHRAWHLATR